MAFIGVAETTRIVILVEYLRVVARVVRVLAVLYDNKTDFFLDCIFVLIFEGAVQGCVGVITILISVLHRHVFDLDIGQVLQGARELGHVLSVGELAEVVHTRTE